MTHNRPVSSHGRIVCRTGAAGLARGSDHRGEIHEMVPSSIISP